MYWASDGIRQLTRRGRAPGCRPSPACCVVHRPGSAGPTQPSSMRSSAPMLPLRGQARWWNSRGRAGFGHRPGSSGLECVGRRQQVDCRRRADQIHFQAVSHAGLFEHLGANVPSIRPTVGKFLHAGRIMISGKNSFISRNGSVPHTPAQHRRAGHDRDHFRGPCRARSHWASP